MNKHGFNCLTFTDKPGRTICDIQTAEEIAEDWNRQVDTHNTGSTGA